LIDRDRKLRHAPFFEELGALNERSQEWLAASAGLVVLRLVDAWINGDAGTEADRDWGVRSVRAAIDEVSSGTPIRAILARIVEALEEPRGDIHAVVSPLMAYGQALEYDAKWSMATDVYQTVLAHIHPIEDCDASIAAHLRLGQCFRNLHQIDKAAEAFASASKIAGEVGDIVGVLRARVGEARIAIIRGNLPRAESILDDTIIKAVGPDMRDVRSRALHDRSEVATLRGQYDLAISLAYEALGHSQSQTARDRILNDIAVAFMELGVYSAARDAYLVLSSTAQEQYLRWAATINLMEIASQTGVEMLFETYRRQLADEDLPPYLATAFELNAGVGFQRFGNFGRAKTHLERAMQLAGDYGLNQFLFQAEEALFQLQTPTPPRRVPEKLSLDLEEVAGAIRRMKEEAGV